MSVWYRFVDWPTAPGCDEVGDPLPGPGGCEVVLREYEVVKKTPCGVWLRTEYWLVDDGPGQLLDGCRWVKRDAHRRFACPTITEAMESFKARKRRQASIYEARSAYAYRAIAECERRYGKEPIDDFAA